MTTRDHRARVLLLPAGRSALPAALPDLMPAAGIRTAAAAATGIVHDATSGEEPMHATCRLGYTQRTEGSA